MKTITIALALILIILATTASAGFYGTDKETKTFLKAKEEVFDRDWDRAKSKMESYLKHYPDGRYEDEAYYWLAR